MSFLNIEDPKERDAIVKEYLATVIRIQQKNLNEKAQDLVRTEDIERTLEPVVRSTKQSAESITKELVPIKDEIKLLNERLENRENNRQRQHQRDDKKEEEDPERDVVQMFYDKVPEEKLDKYFGIVKEDGRYKMGNKYVQVHSIDLLVDHKRYAGTKGLWSLIMTARPEGYSHEDFVKYRDVIAHTNAMAYPNNVTSASRVRTTKKWRSIFPKFEDIEGEVSPSIRRRVETTPAREEVSTLSHITHSHGEGIVQFLPSDIKGLETKLNYLLGEYRAGNRSSTVRNETVSILDELLRRKRISRKEYRNINNYLQ